jgi:DNA-binding LacI/PurR family transcriptional regulator
MSKRVTMPRNSLSRKDMSFYMNLPERPTALVVIDDVITFGIMRALNDLGYRIPQDLSLVSFNNIALSELAHPPISSIDIGIYQLGIRHPTYCFPP